jgi:hypothetical protein
MSPAVLVLPASATLYQQPRTTSTVKRVLEAGTVLVRAVPVPDFPGWWSVALSRDGANGGLLWGYIHLDNGLDPWRAR